MASENWVQQLLDQNRRFYELAHHVEAYSQYCEQGLTPEEEKAFGQFFSPPGSRILVLGCGTGRECFYLARRGHDVTGLDVSDKMLAEAQRHRARYDLPVRFVKGDFTRLSPELGKFDTIFFTENIYSIIPSRFLRAQTLRGAARLLDSGGALLLYLKWWARKKIPLYHNRLVTLLRTFKRRLVDPPLREAADVFLQEEHGPEYLYFHYFQLAEDIRREFLKAGFAVEREEGYFWLLRPPSLKTLSTSK